ncbi:hypothetical protein WME90_27050 [Sorangium sp. So ce375]|uniref:hypothetical protein n=1 Tax=Sorangium sp. So ce375 TaxID=3133306 RepID=UPI003F5C9D6B
MKIEATIEATSDPISAVFSHRHPLILSEGAKNTKAHSARHPMRARPAGGAAAPGRGSTDPTPIDEEADGRGAAPRYQSAVTQPAAALAKAPELLAAKRRVLSGDRLPAASVRFAGPAEIDVFLGELDQAIRPFEDSLRKAGARHGDRAAQLKAIIKKASIQTSKTRFEDPRDMAEFDARIERVARSGEPVVLAMPEGGGKVPVPLKTGRFGRWPDFAEFLGIKMRAALARVLREFHPGGAHVVVVPDTCLHTRDMGFCADETRSHLEQLWRDLPRLGVRDEVIVADTLAYLPADWDRVIERSVAEVVASIAADEAVRAAAAAQSSSLMFIKDCGLSDEDEAILFYAAVAGHSDGIPAGLAAQARAFQEATDQVTPLYMAINHHGIRGLGLIERVVEGLGFSSESYLRASVHAKPGCPRPALSVFHSLAPVALLPMHALGVRVIDETPRWGLSFDVVGRMRGWQAVCEATTGRFLFYETTQEGAEMGGASAERAAA